LEYGRNSILRFGAEISSIHPSIIPFLGARRTYPAGPVISTKPNQRISRGEECLTMVENDGVFLVRGSSSKSNGELCDWQATHTLVILKTPAARRISPEALELS